MKLIYFLLATFLALALAVLSVPAFAASRYASESVAVMFDDGPCTEPAIEQILMLSVPDAKNAKAATVTDGSGTSVAACWVDYGEKVVLVDMLGRGGYLPKDKLQTLPAPLTEQPAPA